MHKLELQNFCLKEIIFNSLFTFWIPLNGIQEAQSIINFALFNLCSYLLFHSLYFISQVFDNYAVTVMIGGEPYTLGLFDTAG